MHEGGGNERLNDLPLRPFSYGKSCVHTCIRCVSARPSFRYPSPKSGSGGAVTPTLRSSPNNMNCCEILLACATLLAAAFRVTRIRGAAAIGGRSVLVGTPLLWD